MMKPYYEDYYVTIYHGDCHEILPALSEVDLVVTDPPFTGMRKGVSYQSYDTGAVGRHRQYQAVGNDWDADIAWVAPAWQVLRLGMVVFCSFHSVADVRWAVEGKAVALVTWYKRNTPPSAQNAPHFSTEFVWLFQKAPGLLWKNMPTMFDIPKLATGAMAPAERILTPDRQAAHPTQKPMQLLGELLKCTESSHTILDPFLGSGTTAVAAKKLNRKCIGVEIEERYCEIAANRCRQSVFELGI